jgi:hypothetical protein
MGWEWAEIGQNGMEQMRNWQNLLFFAPFGNLNIWDIFSHIAFPRGSSSSMVWDE